MKDVNQNLVKKMSKGEFQIDETTHERVPSNRERLVHAALAVLLSFLLIQLIAFWMFPGIGIAGLYMFSSAHSMVSFIGDITNIIMIAVMAVCGVLGWFHGKYFTDRLKGYLSYWKFW